MSKLLINRWLRKTAPIVRYDERNGGVFSSRPMFSMSYSGGISGT